MLREIIPSNFLCSDEHSHRYIFAALFYPIRSLPLHSLKLHISVSIFTMQIDNMNLRNKI